jgi:hypothetical protein
MAYGTLGGLLAGQANSNFRDSDATAEVLEFGGNIGDAGVIRIPQLRYTFPGWWDGSLSVSAEVPETDIATPAGLLGSDAGNTGTINTSCTVVALGSPANCTSTLLSSGGLPTNVAKATAPNFVANYYIPRPWGHLDFSGVFRPALTVDDGKYFSRTFIGFGGQFGMDVKPGWFGWNKDDITLSIAGGNAIGRYMVGQSNFALATNYGAPGGYGSFGGPTSAAAAAAIIFKPTTEFGGEVGYQHWWLPDLRSNVSLGLNYHDIPKQLIGAAQAGVLNKELMTSHANVIWNPVSFVEAGFEYMWGKRRVVSNLRGTENVLTNRLRFFF